MNAIVTDYPFHRVLAVVPWGFREGTIAFWWTNTFRRSLDGCLPDTSGSGEVDVSDRTNCYATLLDTEYRTIPDFARNT